VWRLSLGLLLTLRVGLELVGLASMNVAPPTELNGRWSELVGANGEPAALALWQRWDALWYQKIATDWYRPGDDSIHFEPLYPLVVRLVPGPVVLAELFVASAAFFAAMTLLGRLAEREFGCEVGRVAVLLTALFPSGFFLLAPYTESLYLVLTLAAFWYARADRPWLAGLFGGRAGLPRPVGAFLVLPLAYEALRQRDERGERYGLGVLAAALPGVGLAAATAYQRWLVGETRSMLEVAEPWGDHLSPPWRALPASWEFIWSRGGDPPELVNMVALIGAIGLAIYALRRLPLAYALYALPYLALLASRQSAAAPLESVARYVVVLFPCFFVLAWLLAPRRGLAAACLAIGLMLQVVLFERWVHFGFVG
jgi:hypothetical protein